PEEQAAEWLRAAWYMYLLIFHRRQEQEYTELSRLIEERMKQSKFRLSEELETMGKTMAQFVEERGRAKGRAEGEEQGRAEGEAQGLRRALQALLQNRFGDLDARAEAALASASLETLDRWFRAALTARTLADVGIPSD